MSSYRLHYIGIFLHTFVKINMIISCKPHLVILHEPHMPLDNGPSCNKVVLFCQNRLNWAHVHTRWIRRRWNTVLFSEGRKKMFYLTTHSTHFIYGYMASDSFFG